MKKLKAFTHHNVESIDEAASLLGEYGRKAKIIAGGTDLLCVMRDFILPEYPEAIVNIKGIQGLDYIKEEAGVLKIGALAPVAEMIDDATIKSKYIELSQAADAVGTPELRNMGTIGGNLCQEVRCWYYRTLNNYFFCFRKGGTLCNAIIGDNRYNAILGGSVCFAVCPSDIAIALGALNATIVTNKRSVPIDDFFVVLGNILDNDEIITEIQVPEPKSGTKQVFLKFRIRKAIDFAISSVATAINVDGGVVTDARIVLGGVAPMPYRATDAEEAILGNSINESTAETAGENAVIGAVPLSKNKYLIPITKALVKRAVLA